MRLINVDTLKLEQFTSKIPPYAILSHTWISGQEVTLQDMERPRRSVYKKKGWAKIQNCCRQAIHDGWSYVWVDTCCIDKTNSVELSEAINSMFRWYKEAALCYAYLADVRDPVCIPEDTQRDKAAHITDFKFRGKTNGDTIPKLVRFTNSRWFQRGWTLQELLAPVSVVFFSHNWMLLGTRDSLLGEITLATNINCQYLATVGSFREASVAAIFSWAAKRETERTEDRAYSLLGLFGIHMPLIYGEGDAAFRRLQLQIMEDRDDETIFAWMAGDMANYGPMLLARSPVYFHNCGRFIVRNRDAYREGSMTFSKGHVLMRAGLYRRLTHWGSGDDDKRPNLSISGSDGDYLLITNCFEQYPPNNPSSEKSNHRQKSVGCGRQVLFRLTKKDDGSNLFHFYEGFKSVLPLQLPTEQSKVNSIKGFTRGQQSAEKGKLRTPCLDLYGEKYEPLPPMSIRITYQKDYSETGFLNHDLEAIYAHYSIPNGAWIFSKLGVRSDPDALRGNHEWIKPISTWSRRLIQPRDFCAIKSFSVNDHLYEYATIGTEAKQKDLIHDYLSLDSVLFTNIIIPLPNNKCRPYTVGIVRKKNERLARYGIWPFPETGSEIHFHMDNLKDFVAQYPGEGKRLLEMEISEASLLPRSVVHEELGCQVTVLQWPQLDKGMLDDMHKRMIRFQIRVEELSPRSEDDESCDMM